MAELGGTQKEEAASKFTWKELQLLGSKMEEWGSRCPTGEAAGQAFEEKGGVGPDSLLPEVPESFFEKVTSK